MMKKIILVVGFALFSMPAMSNRAVHHFEFDENGVVTETVPCLGIDITFFITFKGRYHEFDDNSGGSHIMSTTTVTGKYVAIGQDMSWTITRGILTYVNNFSGDNGRFVIIDKVHEVAHADGDYPDLLFTFGFSGTLNANGDLVSLRLTDPTYRCLPD